MPLCAVCQDGYTQASDLTCLICPTMAETVAQNLGVICGVVVKLGVERAPRSSSWAWGKVKHEAWET